MTVLFEFIRGFKMVRVSMSQQHYGDIFCFKPVLFYLFHQLIQTGDLLVINNYIQGDINFYATLVGIGHHIGDDEEEGRVAHAVDDRELMVKPRADGLGKAAVAPLGAGECPGAQEIAGAARAYKVHLTLLLFDRGISGKIAGQEIRGLRAALPADLPLIVSGRAVNLLAKPIASVRTAADFSSVMSTMRELGVLPLAPVSLVGMLPDPQQRV